MFRIPKFSALNEVFLFWWQYDARNLLINKIYCKEAKTFERSHRCLNVRFYPCGR